RSDRRRDRLVSGRTASGFGPILRWFAGLMLIAMGLYLASWWSGLTKLEAVGAHLWKHLQPFSQRLLPVRTPGQALLLGGIWGWLPCGLVYSALAWSASAASIGEAALLMTFFGLGTLPAVLATGYFAKQITRFQRLRAVRAITGDRKSTRLNSSHVKISYAVFCLKKKII